MFSSSRLHHLHHHLSRRFSSLQNSNPNPNPISMRSALRSLFKEQDPDTLTAEIKRLSDSPAFRRKIGAYEIVVLRLAAAGRPDAIIDILDYQKRYTADFADEAPVSRLIALYGCAGMLNRAVDTFRKLPGPRSIRSFNSLLTVFARANDFDRISTLFREIPSDDPSIVPNTVSYNILISALCKNNQLDAALDILCLMNKSESAPDLITFNTLLNGFYSAGRIADGESIWVQMIDMGIKPDTISYNAKLRALASEGKVSEAEELVGELQHAGLKPDTYTFNELIRGYCQCGDWSKSRRILKKMAESECVPNRWTYEILIPELCKAGQLCFALKLCNQCINDRCFVNSRVLQEVVNGLVKTRRVEAAKKLVEFGKIRRHLRNNLKTPLSSLFVAVERLEVVRLDRRPNVESSDLPFWTRLLDAVNEDGGGGVGGWRAPSFLSAAAVYLCR